MRQENRTKQLKRQRKQETKYQRRLIKDERARIRRRKRRRKGLLITFLTLVILGSVFALLMWKVFTVKSVEVTGNALYEDSVIEETVLNDEYSWNSLYVLLKYKFTETKDIPFVDKMSVRLKNPHTIQIDVYEKGLLGYLNDPETGQYVYFDKEGFAAEISQHEIKGIPQITGIEIGEIKKYEKLSIDKEVLSDMLTLTQTLKRSSVVPEQIKYESPDSPVLMFGNVWVQMGSERLLSQKVERLARILPSVSGQSGVLHLENWTEDSANIVFDRDE